MTFLPWLLSSSFLLLLLLLTVEWLEGRTTGFVRAFVSSPPQHRGDSDTVWHRNTARIDDDDSKKKVRRKFSFVYLQNHDDHDTDNAIDTDSSCCGKGDGCSCCGSVAFWIVAVRSPEANCVLLWMLLLRLMRTRVSPCFHCFRS